MITYSAHRLSGSMSIPYLYSCRECGSTAPPTSMDGCKVATAPNTGMESQLGPQSTLKEDTVSQRVEEITPSGEQKAPSEAPAAKKEPKEQNGVKHEGGSKKDAKSEESDEDLKKYNRKIPEERSAVKKDEIDAHFDRCVSLCCVWCNFQTC